MNIRWILWGIALLGQSAICLGLAISAYVSYGTMLPFWSCLCIAGGIAICADVLIAWEQVRRLYQRSYRD